MAKVHIIVSLVLVILVSSSPTKAQTTEHDLDDLIERREQAAIKLQEALAGLNGAPDFYAQDGAALSTLELILERIEDLLFKDKPLDGEKDALCDVRDILNLFVDKVLDHASSLETAGKPAVAAPFKEFATMLLNLVACIDQFKENHMSPKKEVVDNDPHFLVHVGGTPICFDFHGGNNDVIQLLNDDVTGMTVNGQLFETSRSTPQHQHSYFSAITVIHQHCVLLANRDYIQIGRKKFNWNKEEIDRVCSMTLQTRKDKEILIVFDSGIHITILLHTDKPAIGPYLGVYFSDTLKLSNKTHGLLGQLFNKKVDFLGNLRRIHSEGEMEVVSQDDFQYQNVISSVYKYNKMTNKRERCWMVPDSGQVLIDGNKEDYFVPNQDLYHAELLSGLQQFVI